MSTLLGMVGQATHTDHAICIHAILPCSYRKLALKFHPEINTDVKARDEFNRICEAYDVLSDRKCAGCALPLCVLRPCWAE